MFLWVFGSEVEIHELRPKAQVGCWQIVGCLDSAKTSRQKRVPFE